MKIDFEKALTILEYEAAASRRGSLGAAWRKRIASLSQACSDKSKTMIAMLGTALLAKATNIDVDVFGLKASAGPKSYSARALCKDVLAAHAPRLGIDLGVLGREPLNNQPFFGKLRVTTDLTIKKNAAGAFAILLEALAALDAIENPAEARLALRTFLRERTVELPRVAIGNAEGDQLEESTLIELIERLVSAGGEYGKRAQAVAAGLLDVLMTKTERVSVASVHDPDRRFPGDVGIRAQSDFETDILERTFEVRDKPVVVSDIHHLVEKVRRNGVAIVGMLAVAAKQAPIDVPSAKRWANERGVRLAVYVGWRDFVREALFWAAGPGPIVGSAYRAILRRAINLGVSKAGLEFWKRAGSKG